jgi:hypothetical protein
MDRSGGRGRLVTAAGLEEHPAPGVRVPPAPPGSLRPLARLTAA